MKGMGGRGSRFEPIAIRRATVARPRLVARLRERFRERVTLVVASAGLGKTTLLAQAVAENRLAPRGTDCWLTCTADDAAGSSLAEAVCRALGAAPPEGPDRPVDAAVDAAVEAMWHRSPDEVALVLDDVHEVPPGSPGADALAQLVARMPRNGHVVLSGRRPPPIPLARIEVEGHVLRLDESDLLFTDEELAGLASLRGVPVEQLAGSGGWPALAELAARADPGVKADYLWEEVLAGVGPDRRRDLALLAHVGPFDDRLASAVLGRTVEVTRLTEDLPLVAATGDGGREIHALWRPHLAKSVSGAEIAEARRRAGVELAKAGDVAAAVRLLASAGAWDAVTNVVTDTLVGPDRPVAGDVIATWLGRLPGGMTEAPLARLLGAVASAQIDSVAAQQELEEAADAFRREANPAGELACMVQLARLAWLFEQPERLAALVLRVIEMEALGNTRAQPLACVGRALAAQAAADCETAVAQLDRIPAGALSDAWQGMADWIRTTSLIHLGRPGEALGAAERACGYAGPLYAPVVESARLQALWFLGEIDTVVGALPRLVQRAAATGLVDFMSVMGSFAAVALALDGRPAEAAGYLERARQSGRRAAATDFPVVDVSLVIAEALVAVASGDEPRAARVLHEYVDRSPPLGTGLAALPQQWVLALWYVLVPGSRRLWDTATLGPSFAVGRDLARALVAVREGGRLPAGAPPLPDPNVTRSFLPLPWAAELALAHDAAGREAGRTLLDTLWPRAQPVVRRHAGAQGTALSRQARRALARLPVPPPARLELDLLGPTVLRRDGVPVDAPEWRRERVRSLLAHLVLHRPDNRERLGADLWPALDADAQLRNLRVNLAHLLRVLEPDRAERDASFLVRTHGGGLLLHRGDWFDADVWRFDDLCRRALAADGQGDPSTALDAMQQAVSLWRGEPDELARDAWAITEVEGRRLRVAQLATRAGELLLALGEPDAARAMAETALDVDPWSERSHRLVVDALVAVDDRAALRRALDRYHQALDELGLDPSDPPLLPRSAPHPGRATTR